MAHAFTPASAPNTYAELKRGVEEVVFAGREKIEEAWLRTYHDTGRLIHEHLLLLADKPLIILRIPDDYGYMDPALIDLLRSELSAHLEFSSSP